MRPHGKEDVRTPSSVRSHVSIFVFDYIDTSAFFSFEMGRKVLFSIFQRLDIIYKFFFCAVPIRLGLMLFAFVAKYHFFLRM